MVFARTDRSLLSSWWWTVDRWNLVAIFFLIGIGCLLSLAASPAVAQRIGFESFHFVVRHYVFLLPSLLLMLGISMLTPDQVRRLALVILGGCILALIMTLLIGAERNGAQRWLSLFGMSIQPSEFMKPVFVVVIAWLLSGSVRDTGLPGIRLACGLTGLIVSLLVLQPDMGQTALVLFTTGAIMFLAGMPLLLVGVLAVLGVGGAILAYLFVGHVTSRVNRFLNPESGDTYQIDTAMDAFRTGGVFGVGPGEGSVKRILPDAHTDYIFAVMGEEFGMVASILLVCLFAFIVLRAFIRTHESEDQFVQLAASGLAILFGMQALINMAVNVNLIPSKGMTLPLISYGGSSMFAIALTIGMLLALTRENARSLGAVQRHDRARQGVGHPSDRARWASEVLR